MISRVKICGITRLQDAQEAIAAGASALGFVFYGPSPRYIDPESAANIIAALPPFITTTALFVDEDPKRVSSIVAQTQIDLLQFHGAEDENYCRQFNTPFIKALRVQESTDIAAAVASYPSARALLLDTYVKGVPGGTGAVFNWQLIPEQLRPQIILAGGLDATNVAAAIGALRPFAVDVSGGVEAQKGIKCTDKIRAFMAEVGRVNLA
ncbi:N-(5'-phosphoribosyl)anthranilate isomerase ['Osedax' symbiont bacterium Rs2_46_30_T18]|nr:N-(5'-phosphoribosyl)anthranilate isomerase ['Osedax' symbiont bacterium Rs2_46_30_T18]